MTEDSWREKGRQIVRRYVALGTFMKLLTHRERMVLLYREKGQSLSSTAKNFKVTRERIRQIEDRGLRKLSELAKEAT